MNTSFPHASDFSIVSHTAANHEFIMERYADTIQNMQKTGTYVAPNKIEAILQLLAVQTADLDKKTKEQSAFVRLGQKFSELRGTRDVDQHRIALEKLLEENETHLEQTLKSLIPINGRFPEDRCLSLGLALTELSTHLKTSQTAEQAHRLFSLHFASHIAACDSKGLDSWTKILLQTHPELQWIGPVIEAKASDEKLQALAGCLDKHLQQEHPAKKDLLLFLHLKDAAQVATGFKTAYTLFRILQTAPEKGHDDSLIKGEQLATFLARFLKKYTPVGDREYIEKALRLLMQQQGTNWLDQLLDKNTPESHLDALVDHIETFFQTDIIRTSDVVFTVYNRYKIISENNPPFSKIEQLRIALWIETKIPCRFATRVFQKRETGLACHIQYDIGGDLFLLFGKNKSKFKKEGTFKRHTAALLLPRTQDDKPRTVSHGMNHAIQETAEYEEYYSDYDDLSNFRREANIHQKFSGKKGIWPILSFCEFEKIKKVASQEITIPRISLITEYAPYDLTEWKKLECSDYQFFLLCDALIHGLDAFHSHGWLIGDIKQENILLEIVSRMKLEAGFTDFGNSFSKDEDSPFRTFMQNGWYGCEKFTAPELFGNQDFKGDLLKAEVWALGCVLYETYIDILPWPLYIKHVHDERQKITDEESTYVKKLVQTHIENSERLLSSRKNRTPREELTLWIYQLLHLDPTRRASTQEAIKSLRSIGAQL
jgi:serine/threonine protein kinase